MGGGCFIALVHCPILEDTKRLLQWCGQDIADARAQHGHTIFVRTSTQSAEALKKIWGHSPSENLGIYSLPGRFRDHTVAQCKLLSANLRTMSI